MFVRTLALANCVREPVTNAPENVTAATMFPQFKTATEHTYAQT